MKSNLTKYECKGLKSIQYTFLFVCLFYWQSELSTFFKLIGWVRHHQLGLLARVSLAFFFAVVPAVVVIWDYYGFLVCRDGLYFFLG
jgi:hypothetical protein